MDEDAVLDVPHVALQCDEDPLVVRTADSGPVAQPLEYIYVNRTWDMGQRKTNSFRTWDMGHGTRDMTCVLIRKTFRR